MQAREPELKWFGYNFIQKYQKGHTKSENIFQVREIIS
jgi:hypothetical protein